MLPIIRQFLEQYYPYLRPFYFLAAWGLFFLLVFQVISLIVYVHKRSQKMHQIPCTSCQYFTYNFHLKCPVNPKIANTESAINCPDFHPRKTY